mgnify:CR=1 FL=1
MESPVEVRQLIAHAGAALKASVDILSDESLPLAARISAHLKCLEAHARICAQLVGECNLSESEQNTLSALMSYRPSQPEPAEDRRLDSRPGD